MAVAVIGDDFHGDGGIGPDRGVVRFGRRAYLAGGAAEVDVADLLGPEVVFRHEGEAAEGADAAQAAGAPAGFLDNLAVKRGERVLSGVDAAAGKLEFGFGFALVGQEDLALA